LGPDAVWHGAWGRSVDGCIRWGGDCRGGRAVLGVNLVRPIVTNGTLLHSCVEVRERIELSFGVVSGISGGMGV